MGVRKTPKSQYQKIEAWKKENMKCVSLRYKKDFVDDFRDACNKLGVKQSDIFRDAMENTIKKAHNS